MANNAKAQDEPAPPDSAERKAVIDSISNLLAEYYVFKEADPRILQEIDKINAITFWQGDIYLRVSSCDKTKPVLVCLWINYK